MQAAGREEGTKVVKEEEMEQVAAAASAKLHAAQLQGKGEPRVTVPGMIAIAFIMFHKTIEVKKRVFVEEDFKRLRSLRDDTWLKGGEGFIAATAAAAAEKKGKKKATKATKAAAKACPIAAAEAPPAINTTDDSVAIVQQLPTAIPGTGAGAKRVKIDPNLESQVEGGV